MKNINKDVVLLRSFIIIICIFILYMIIFYYPNQLKYLLTDDYYSNKLNVSNEMLFYVPVIFYVLVGIPLLLVLLIYWIISIFINKNNLFSNKTLKLMRLSIIIMWIDLSFYSIGNLFFYNKMWPNQSNYNFQLIIICLIFTIVISILELIIKREVLLNSIEQQKMDS